MKKPLKELRPTNKEVPWLIGLALTVLIAGLSLPILTVEKTVFWRHWENHYSVFVGVVELAKHGDWLLALILFFFSMVFPFAKLATLAAIWRKPMSQPERLKMLKWLGLLGKWSMLDVFVVAILIVAAKLRDLTEVQPRVGLYLFGLAIILSMLSTMHVERLVRKPVPAPPAE